MGAGTEEENEAASRAEPHLLLDAERGRGIVVGELLLVSRRERGTGNTSARGRHDLDLAGASVHVQAGDASLRLAGQAHIPAHPRPRPQSRCCLLLRYPPPFSHVKRCPQEDRARTRRDNRRWGAGRAGHGPSGRHAPDRREGRSRRGAGGEEGEALAHCVFPLLREVPFALYPGFLGALRVPLRLLVSSCLSISTHEQAEGRRSVTGAGQSLGWGTQ